MTECADEWIWVSRDIWDNPIFRTDEPASTLGVLMFLASRGRVLHCTARDLAKECGLHPRRLARVLKRLEDADQIAVSGAGGTRTITVTSEFVMTDGEWFSQSVEVSRECGWRIPERGAALWRGGSLPLATRKRILARDGEACRWCGATDGPWHIDHIKAVARGGKDNDTNLCVSCVSCNLSKGAKPLGEWEARNG